MIKLLRWLFGYVYFSITGGPERFLNQCTRSGVTLWNMAGGAQAGACVAASQYRVLHRCARRAGCRIRVVKKHGLPFRARRATRRKGLVAGAVLFVVILQLLSQRVWCVDVIGNELLGTPQLRAELAEMGLKPGMAKKDLDPLLYQQQIMVRFPQIRWLSVNTQGCMAHVTLGERIEKPDMERKDGFCNITAGDVGQVLSMEVYAGTPQVMVGEAVVKGQLLISGIVEDEAGLSSFCRASGRVTAATTRTFHTEIALQHTESEPGPGRVQRRSVSLFGLRLPLSFNEEPHGTYSREITRTVVRLNGVELPITLYEENWTQQQEREVLYTQDQALALARVELEKYEKEELSGAKITGTQETCEVKRGKLFYTANLQCEENIAVESEIVVK